MAEQHQIQGFDGGAALGFTLGDKGSGEEAADLKRGVNRIGQSPLFADLFHHPRVKAAATEDKVHHPHGMEIGGILVNADLTEHDNALRQIFLAEDGDPGVAGNQGREEALRTLLRGPGGKTGFEFGDELRPIKVAGDGNPEFFRREAGLMGGKEILPADRLHRLFARCAPQGVVTINRLHQLPAGNHLGVVVLPANRFEHLFSGQLQSLRLKSRGAQHLLQQVETTCQIAGQQGEIESQCIGIGREGRPGQPAGEKFADCRDRESLGCSDR